MPVQKIEFEYGIPDGCRFVRYGCPKRGEHYMEKGKVRTAEYDYETEWPIVERVLGCERPTETSKRHKNADLIHAWAEGAIIQFKLQDGSWADCLNNDPRWRSDVHYRIKPAIKTIKFRNWLTKSGRIFAWNLIGGDSVEDSNEFKCWVGDWQSVEVGE